MKSNLIYIKKLELFKELDNFKEGEFHAIIDQSVKNHLPQWILFSPHVFWLKDPEDQKNLDIYQSAIDFFLKQGIQRSSTIYAIGGGATTDFAGFVAATILRGVNWVAIPTSLLAMIDGSIGGKVGLNTPHGKNLVGSFHMPERVLVCAEFLTSLPEKEWMSGKGEILKYGFLSKEIYDLIINKAPIEEIILACARFKIEVVEKDFYEKADRVFLNLGHTLGHAFEYELKIPHGEAVAMGLKYLFKIVKNDSALHLFNELAKSLELSPDNYNIKNYPGFNLKSFILYLQQDKKKLNKTIRLVLVKEISSCYIEEVLMKDFIAKIMDYEEFQS